MSRTTPGSVYLIGSMWPGTLKEVFHRAKADTGVARPRMAMSFAPISRARGLSSIVSFVTDTLSGADVTTFTIAGEHDAMPVAEAKAIVDEADIIFVNGGDPILGARRFETSGAGEWLRAAHARGAVCMGISAGAMVLCAAWGSWEDDEDAPPMIVPCVGVVPKLVIDCHAEADDWAELYAVRASMGEGAAGITFAGVGRRSALVLRGGDGAREWVGPALLLSDVPAGLP